MPLPMNSCMRDYNRMHTDDYLAKLQLLFNWQGEYPDNHIFMTIENIGSFERYNNIPYHNHERWATGFRVTVHPYKDLVLEEIVVDHECIQCACERVWKRIKGTVQ